MNCWLHIYDGSFDNAICEQSIASPQEERVIGNYDAQNIFFYVFMNVIQCSNHGLLFD